MLWIQLMLYLKSKKVSLKPKNFDLMPSALVVFESVLMD